MRYELGIIGAGNMAEAIARGVIRAGVYQPEEMVASDVAPARRELFAGELGIRAIESNLEVAGASRRVLLSVKPQQMTATLTALGAGLSDDTLIISIAAGVGSAFIEKHLGSGRPWRVVRVMPNTPMLVGAGMAGIAPGTHATQEDLAHTRRIFESAAAVIDVTEDNLNAVTALSGSGPAYFFYLVEHMVRAGVELGLTPAQAHQLASVTAAGAAKMLATSADSPETLRRKVTSPGGTTQAAVEIFESRGVGAAIVDAVKAADQRGKALGG